MPRSPAYQVHELSMTSVPGCVSISFFAASWVSGAGAIDSWVGAQR